MRNGAVCTGCASWEHGTARYGRGMLVRLYERVSACEETAGARADDGYDGMFRWWGDEGANS